MPLPTLQAQLGKKQPFALVQEEAYLNLARTASVLQGPFSALLDGHDLSESCYNVLRILRGHHPAGLPSQSIGPQMVARVPDVTRLVDRLVKGLLAERARTEQDRRIVLVRITRRGLELLAKLDGPVSALHRTQLSHMTPRELGVLNRLLVKARHPHEPKG